MNTTLVKLVLAGLLSLALVSVAAPGSARGHWDLVVNDRFSSGGVPKHWDRYDGPYGSGAENCARPSHAFVKHGKMRMVLRHRSGGECGDGWYSAGMKLVEKFESVDQKIAIRFRVASRHGVHGHRIIPMRWPSSGEQPGGTEEDYCEGDRVTGCTTFLHSDSGRVYHKYRVNLTKWHTMRFVRRDFTVRAFIDGKRRWTYHGNESTLPATKKRPVLQQECDDSCPSGTRGREIIVIDWIKVWNPA